jgi:hypothetical protein
LAKISKKDLEVLGCFVFSIQRMLKYKNKLVMGALLASGLLGNDIYGACGMPWPFNNASWDQWSVPPKNANPKCPEKTTPCPKKAPYPTDNFDYYSQRFYELQQDQKDAIRQGNWERAKEIEREMNQLRKARNASGAEPRTIYGYSF